ncbi:MAG: hypothetical protein ABI747_02075 [Candidatus Moraniibacteriota bacterium]
MEEERLIHAITAIAPRFVQKFWLISGLLLTVHVLLAVAIAIFFPPSPDSVVLRYNVYFGVDILAAWWQVYLLPLLSLSFVTANTLLAYRLLKKEEKLLSMLLLLGSGVVTFALAVAVSAIVFINY